MSRKARWRTNEYCILRRRNEQYSKFAIKCDKFTINRDGFGNVRGYDIGGIVENKPVYLDFEQVAAVVRVFSDEKEVAHDEQGASIL